MLLVPLLSCLDMYFLDTLFIAAALLDGKGVCPNTMRPIARNPHFCPEKQWKWKKDKLQCCSENSIENDEASLKLDKRYSRS